MPAHSLYLNFSSHKITNLKLHMEGEQCVLYEDPCVYIITHCVCVCVTISKSFR